MRKMKDEKKIKKFIYQDIFIKYILNFAKNWNLRLTNCRKEWQIEFDF